jgi:mevalonate kinase
LKNESLIQVHAKWILSGEHAVLRGSPALVFPLKSKSLKVFIEEANELNVQFKGTMGSDLELLFWGVLEKAMQKVSKNNSDLKKKFIFDNEIPIGAGLGASASLCVAVGRILNQQGWVADSDLYEVCRDLENLFHGESSGVDIAVAMSGEGIKFIRNGERKPVRMNWRPQLFVSYSGKRGVTMECIRKVKSLMSADAKLGQQLDQQMVQSVEFCQRALACGEAEGLRLLKQGMDLALDSFEQWGLAKPMVPRNPYTNQRWSTAQLLHIFHELHTQMGRRGKSLPSFLIKYVESGYCVRKFLEINSLELGIQAAIRFFKTADSDAIRIELLYEMFQQVYQVHNMRIYRLIKARLCLDSLQKEWESLILNKWIHDNYGYSPQYMWRDTLEQNLSIEQLIHKTNLYMPRPNVQQSESSFAILLGVVIPLPEPLPESSDGGESVS